MSDQDGVQVNSPSCALRLRRRQKNASARSARNATPPTTPPTILPVFECAEDCELPETGEAPVADEVPLAVVGVFDCEGVAAVPLNERVVESVEVEDEDDEEEEEAVDNGDASAVSTTVVDEDVVVEVVVELCVETTVLVGVEWVTDVDVEVVVVPPGDGV